MVTVLRWSSDRGGVRKRDGDRSESADGHQLVVAIGGACLTHGTMPPIWLSAPRNGELLCAIVYSLSTSDYDTC